MNTAYPFVNAAEPYVILVACENVSPEFGNVNNPVAEVVSRISCNAKESVWFRRQANKNTPEGGVPHKRALFHVLDCEEKAAG